MSALPAGNQSSRMRLRKRLLVVADAVRRAQASHFSHSSADFGSGRPWGPLRDPIPYGHGRTAIAMTDPTESAVDREAGMALDEVWGNWQPQSAPFALDDDLERLQYGKGASHLTIWRSWEEATQDPNFCEPGDSRLHLGLLPQPFFGNVREASIYVLLLNPGLGPNRLLRRVQRP
jgi:hypothetical protein